MKFGVSRSLGLAVIAMGYALPMQGWPLRPLFVDSKSGRETPTATSGALGTVISTGAHSIPYARLKNLGPRKWQS
jgi:hypothetical protein